MTKQYITTEVAKALNTTATEAKPVVEAIFETLKSTLESGENVEISGFGKFGSRFKVAWMGVIRFFVKRQKFKVGRMNRRPVSRRVSVLLKTGITFSVPP